MRKCTTECDLAIIITWMFEVRGRAEQSIDLIRQLDSVSERGKSSKFWLRSTRGSSRSLLVAKSTSEKKHVKCKALRRTVTRMSERCMAHPDRFNVEYVNLSVVIFCHVLLQSRMILEATFYSRTTTLAYMELWSEAHLRNNKSFVEQLPHALFSRSIALNLS